MADEDQEVPDSMDADLEIAIDNSNAMFDDVATAIRRHMHESCVTTWQVIGALEVIKTKLIHGESI